ncbi:MAG: hypothetical protein Q7R49_01860 [Candidatus Daviesbacteria bacterium]|nr:hypothetical protein [Candidatus Daviesbacteria bacterium]
MLDSLNKDSINIRDINLTEVSPWLGQPFDPARGLTESDWKEIKIRSNDLALGNVLDLAHAADLRILFPEKDFGLDEESWFSTQELISRRVGIFVGYPLSLSPGYYIFAIQDLANALLVFPERLSQIKNYYSKLKNAAEDKGFNIFEAVKDYKIETKLVNISRIAILSQDDLSSYPQLETFKEEALMFVQILKNKTNLDIFQLNQLANFRIIFPNQELSLPTNEWRSLKNYLEEDIRYARASNDPEAWNSFASLASLVRIIAAQEIKITDHGLELFMPEPKSPLTEETPALPEMRKF